MEPDCRVLTSLGGGEKVKTKHFTFKMGGINPVTDSIAVHDRNYLK